MQRERITKTVALANHMVGEGSNIAEDLATWRPSLCRIHNIVGAPQSSEFNSMHRQIGFTNEKVVE